MKISRLLVLLFFLSIYTFYSQELPPINTFSTKDYGGENQNWAVSQAENKFIYVANNKGLLEYNGANWKLYPTPNETIMRSVKAFNDKVFTGFYMDFGYWKKNELGVFKYHSIAKELDVKLIEDEQIWDIVEIDGWMLFKSLHRIYLYSLEKKVVKIINASKTITDLTKVEGALYFQELGKGIFMIENGNPKLISDDEILKNNAVVNIFKKEGKLLFLTQEKGFYYLDNNKVVLWNAPANNVILNKRTYSGIRLKNKDFVLGTISDGLIYIKNNGTFNYQINQSLGLSNNTVLSIFEDKEDNIWLGLDNGINCVNNTSPFKIYKDKANFWGTIYASVIHNEMLYLGTNQGLFYKKNGTDNQFKFVENTQGQVWSLKEIDGELFCGHDSGTFIIKNEKAKKIIDIQGTWDIKKIDTNTLMQGNYDGLYIIKKVGNTWQLKNKIEGFNNSSRYFEVLNNKILVNHEYKSIYKLRVSEEYKEAISVEKDSVVKKGLHSSLVKYKGNVFYASKKGIFKYLEDKNTFQLDSVYSNLLLNGEYTSGKLIHNTDEDKLWFFSKDNIKYLTPGKLSNTPIVQAINIPEVWRKGASGFENILTLSEKKFLIGTSNGYLIIDLNHLEKTKNFNISINEGNSFVLGESKKVINLKEKVTFHNKENNIEFFFSVPNYSKISTSKYKYELVGEGKHFSDWDEANSILFENLTYGDYTFRVKANIGNQMSVNTAEYHFTIAKPWYLSSLMIMLYIIIFIIISFTTHFLHRRFYKKQREKLLEKSQKELALKELESSQKIIRLNNEKLRNDIASKNRELATSTMSIIKKNEFLNDIKSELKNGDIKNIHKVVTIIDKNLNNTDDWKLFQEAFNNADKKFLKKIKSKHKDLTPNDLRLCAYLRLNLSSKEIAPLLNISPRSVEVKRYRLRKKIKLPHHLNLTNYILEI
ncbi:MAG: two-component regulator propeller domain-containing protein [Polaribacter sp.]